MSVSLLHSPLLLSARQLAHGFTTREGGASVGALASLNLGTRPHERPEAVEENWGRVARAMGDYSAADVALLSQVHGDTVVVVREGLGPHRTVAVADGAVCTTRGVILAVRVADCVPVLISSAHGVGVAHAGWRGTASGVVQAVARALADETGDSPEDMSAAIGPHISADVYEVGQEVVEALRPAGIPERTFLRIRPGLRPTVDLGAAVEWQLRAIGMDRVSRLGVCTASDRRFFSHRRDGEQTGRSAGVIALRRTP